MSHDLHEIKKYIYRNELVEKLLEKLDCDYIKRKDNRIEARRPGGNNRRGIAVYLDEQLVCKIWTKSHLPTIDIFGLVSFIRHDKESDLEIKNDLFDAKQFIIESLSLEKFENGSYKYKKNKEEDQNDWLKRLKNKGNAPIASNIKLPESILNQYVMLPHIKWLKEGLLYSTQQKFEIGYCMDSQRIIFPIRDKDGDIVSIKGRRTISLEDNPKYIYMYKFNKSSVLYNLNNALSEIEKKNEIIIFESEKSCMVAYQYGYKNCVAIGGSDLSNNQIQLIKKIGIDTKIIIMMDKDKDKREIKKQAKKITNRNVYVMWDKNNLLGNPELKQSPTDCGKEVFIKLLENHIYKINNT